MFHLLSFFVAHGGPPVPLDLGPRPGTNSAMRVIGNYLSFVEMNGQ